MAHDGGDRDGDEPCVAPTPTLTDRAPGLEPPASGRPEPEDDERYELRAELARGGGGRVVRAFDRKLGREVAIKFPHDDEEGAALRQRLEREVRILAGLEHPAIVPIHDAGIWKNGQPYFAMRLLGGRTLRDAMRTARSFDERLGLLPVAEAIADAMAYAHGHGVIHRDLKPGNVVVGALGDTVVIDWGLARRRDDASTSDERTAPHRPAGALAADETAARTLTATGAVIGTPAYMAPEQARGEPADARTDVYAIGVILYELLAGTRPHDGNDSADVVAQLLAGPPPPLDDREPRVRAELVAIVAKAMARVPGDRYRDAGELAEDLRRYQAGRLVAAHRYSRPALAARWLRRRAAALAIVVAIAATGTAVATGVFASRRAVAAPDCARNGDMVWKIWGPARGDALRGAFAATRVPYADDVAAAILPRLDGAAKALADARIEVCRATRRGEQSEARHDVRMGCLDQQLARLDATVALLASADAAVVEVAPRAIDALDDPAACADVARLALTPPEPVDPDARAALARLRTRLATAEAARIAGRGAAVVDEVRAIAAAAEQVGYCPIAAQAQHELGWILNDTAGSQDERTAARDLLRRAVLAADACGDDQTRANALIDLLQAWDTKDAAGLARLSADAEAAAQRLTDPRTEVRLLVVRAQMAADTGDLERAIALFDRGRAAAAPYRGLALAIDLNLAIALFYHGDMERAQATAEASIAAVRRDYGDDHPMFAQAQQLQGQIYLNRGEPRRAAEVFAGALRIQEAALGPEHEQALMSRVNRAGALKEAGEHATAVAELEQVLPIATRVFGADAAQVLFITEALANVYVELGRLDEALPLARAVLATSARTAGPDHPATARAHTTLGDILSRRGEHVAAILELRAALAIQSTKLGSESRDTAWTSSSLGLALVEVGQPAKAIPLLRRARPVLEKVNDPSALGRLELTLARALWDSGGDRAEARALATSAQARAGASDKLRGWAAEWLAAHREPVTGGSSPR